MEADDLRLLWGSSFASANGPHRFIGNHNRRRVQLVLDRCKLLIHYVQGATSLSLLKCLSNAKHNFQRVFEGIVQLLRKDLGN